MFTAKDQMCYHIEIVGKYDGTTQSSQCLPTTSNHAASPYIKQHHLGIDKVANTNEAMARV